MENRNENEKKQPDLMGFGLGFVIDWCGFGRNTAEFRSKACRL
jgi:hypothetical protein